MRGPLEIATVLSKISALRNFLVAHLSWSYSMKERQPDLFIPVVFGSVQQQHDFLYLEPWQALETIPQAEQLNA